MQVSLMDAQTACSDMHYDYDDNTQSLVTTPRQKAWSVARRKQIPDIHAHVRTHAHAEVLTHKDRAHTHTTHKPQPITCPNIRGEVTVTNNSFPLFNGFPFCLKPKHTAV